VKAAGKLVREYKNPRDGYWAIRSTWLRMSGSCRQFSHVWAQLLFIYDAL